MAIYFIQRGFDGPVKIGFSTDIKKRLSALQTSHDAKLRVIRAFDGSESDEASLHARFYKHRLQGEWFSPEPEILTGDIGLATLRINFASKREIAERRGSARERRAVAVAKRAARMADAERQERVRRRCAKTGSMSRLIGMLKRLEEALHQHFNREASVWTPARIETVLYRALDDAEKSFAQCPDVMEIVRTEAPALAGHRSRMILARIDRVTDLLRKHGALVSACHGGPRAEQAG